MIKMIATDLDNTLLKADKTISEYTASVFERCRKKGIKIVFATARLLSMITDFAEIIEIDGLVATNGAFIYAGDTLVYESLIPVDISKKLLLELGTNPQVYKISARKHDMYYTNVPRDNTDCVFDFTTELCEEISHLSFRTADIALAAEITKKYSNLEIHHVSGEELYDVEAKGCTKANAIKQLCKLFSISQDEVAAFGDDYNDIEMLEYCGMGIAVANAIDEVKAVADFICGTNENDGVAKWIEENIL